MWATAWEAPVTTARRAPHFVGAPRRVVVVNSSSSRRRPTTIDNRRRALLRRWGEGTPGRSGVVFATPDSGNSDSPDTSQSLEDASRALEPARALGEELANEAGAIPGDEDDEFGEKERTGNECAVESSIGIQQQQSRSVDTGTKPLPVRKRKRERVRNFLRRARGLQALTDAELLELHIVKQLQKESTKRANGIATAKKLALKAAKKAEKARLKAKQKGRTTDTSVKKKVPLHGLKPKRRKKDPYDSLRGQFSKEKLRRFFNRRPGEVARRLATVLRVGVELLRLWRREEKLPFSERTRGKQLRDALSNLGPVFVKIGQTLSQRPDLIGDEAADSLKELQSGNKPFSDGIAWSTIAEDLEFNGPLGVGHMSQEYCADPSKKPLFQEFSDAPIAAASLGQVYKAKTWDGNFVAVKVQRPNVVRQVALDWTVWSLCLSALTKAWSSKANLNEIADEVGQGVFKELDYVNEAKNMDTFNKKHDWLGFVRAPFWYPEYTGTEGAAKVLTTEWIDGKHISDITDQKTRLRMAQMAVEACVAQLTYTGFVHADPHEGNILLDEKTGELVFLDFGLIATVDENIMEGFARGIQCMIAGDWIGLTYVFRDVGMCPQESFYRKDWVEEDGVTFVSNDEAEAIGKKERKKKGIKKVDVPCSPEEMAFAIEQCLTAEEGGQSRFGALATGLGAMSGRYKFLTPPYIVLLVRTFLTLEGIAQKADPEFNIYAASLPYAIRRAMAPATAKGKTQMRDAFLNVEDNTVRWDRIAELLGNSEEVPEDGSVEMSSELRETETDGVDFVEGVLFTEPSVDEASSIDESELEVLRPMAKAGEELLTEVMDTASFASASSNKSNPETSAGEPSMSTEAGKELIAKRSQEVVGRLMGAKEGAALRRVASDADSVDVARFLASDAARPLRSAGVATMANVLRDVWTLRRAAIEHTNATMRSDSSASSSDSSGDWPESDGARVIRKREDKTKRKAMRVILGGHLRKLLNDGPRGVLLVIALALTAVRMSLLAFVFAGVGTVKEWIWDSIRFLTKGIANAPRTETTKGQGKEKPSDDS
mgnify:FL=1|tara:strand:+ start:28964 stop:32131 length:3168 start_codon:yes stop_codon:yes gene_type:complete